MKIRDIKFLKGDIFIVGLILLLAITIFIVMLPKTYENNYLEIYLDGELLYRIELTEETKEVITIDSSVQNTISIDGTQVSIIDATCYDHICETTGCISKAGEVIVCMPNKLLLKIVGEEAESDFDAVVG